MSDTTPLQLQPPASVRQRGDDLVITSADGQRHWEIYNYLEGLQGGERVSKLSDLNYPVALRRYPAVDGEWWAMGTRGDDVMVAGDFDINISGRDGDDIVMTGAGCDYLCGDAGNDWLIAGEGDDRLYGETGDDSLDGGAGADLLVGGEGDDMLAGGEGNDLLKGGKGNDLLYGGSGDDVYLICRGDGQDRILSEPGGGQDIVRFIGGITVDRLWFRRIGTDLQISVMGTDDSVTMNQWYAPGAHRTTAFEVRDGGVGADNTRRLNTDGVDALVDAMSAFAPTSLGATSLPDNYAVVLNPVLAAQWG